MAVAAITHGVAVVTTEGQVEHVAMPDPMVTNICFDRTTAYVTLSGRGPWASSVAQTRRKASYSS